MKSNLSNSRFVLKDILRLLWYMPALFFIIFIIIDILHGLSFGFNTYVYELFFSSINNINSDINTMYFSIKMALFLCLVLVLHSSVNGISNYMASKKELIFTKIVKEKLYERCSKISLINYENSEFLDNLKKAKDGADNCSEFVFNVLDVFTFYMPYMIYMLIYLYRKTPALSIIIVLAFLPGIFSQIFRMNVYDEFADGTGSVKRKYDYYEKCMTDVEYMKETRCLGIFEFFYNKFSAALNKYNYLLWKTEKKAFLYDIKLQLLNVSANILIIVILFYFLYKEQINIAEFAAIFASINRLFTMMYELIDQRIAKFSTQFGYIKNLVAFLHTDVPEESKKLKILEKEQLKKITLKNVSFKYPNTTRYAVENVSIDISQNETVAIVGVNGSGKSTVCKLIMGLYDPSEGEVYYNDVNFKDVDYKSRFINISAVFQNYIKYKDYLDENVVISRIDLYDSAHLDTCVKNAGINMNNNLFENGYKTMLCKEYDGIDLSGGQWQRVAIARGLYRKGHVIILDEPTASIDPIAENEVYKRFVEMSTDNISIIITHRLASAKLADKIIVMDNGNVVGIGTHRELIKKNIIYKILYESQSVWYK